MAERVVIPATEAEVVLERDVVVCGAGSAGLGAALAAAREGATVALVERWPFFGGNATAASLGSICGLYLVREGRTDYLSRGIAKEWAEGLVASGAALGPMPYKDTAVLLYAPWGYKRLADRLIREERNVTPLLHSFVAGVVRSGDAIDAVVLATKRGPMAVRGRVFVDATGDADVAYHAGCPTEMGRPGRLQYPSMQFFVQNVDVAAAFAAGLDKLNEEMRRAMDEGTFRLTRSAGAAIPTGRAGEIVGAMTRVSRPDGGPPDATDPFELTRAEFDGRDVAEEASRFLAARMPGFADSYIQDTAVTLGVRETRHVVGEDVLTFERASACDKPADGIAASAWPFEFHTEGSETRWEHLPAEDWFEVPYRSLVVSGASNLLAAGRCVSAEHEALASLRVTGVCMAIGESAGIAAARCARSGDALRDFDAAALREELRERDLLPAEGGR